MLTQRWGFDSVSVSKTSFLTAAVSLAFSVSVKNIAFPNEHTLKKKKLNHSIGQFFFFLIHEICFLG